MNIFITYLQLAVKGKFIYYIHIEYKNIIILDCVQEIHNMYTRYTVLSPVLSMWIDLFHLYPCYIYGVHLPSEAILKETYHLDQACISELWTTACLNLPKPESKRCEKLSPSHKLSQLFWLRVMCEKLPHLIQISSSSRLWGWDFHISHVIVPFVLF